MDFASVSPIAVPTARRRSQPTVGKEKCILTIAERVKAALRSIATFAEAMEADPLHAINRRPARLKAEVLATYEGVEKSPSDHHQLASSELGRDRAER
jgi:hypothetical protein